MDIPPLALKLLADLQMQACQIFIYSKESMKYSDILEE
jgi:hypothetical protein